MMSHFLQLLKRGRYISLHSLATAEADKKTQQRRHEERERFSVAAIAFCLEHDKTFKSHFLAVLTSRVSSAVINTISVEPHQWGDLVLEGPKHVFVLEFKLSALLQDHQAPDALVFSQRGYGA